MSVDNDKTTMFTETGISGMVCDWSSDKQAFDMPWGMLMMWIFLLSDTFIFSIFLTGYMNVRMSATDQWPNSSEVFALTLFGVHLPLILIAIMTFVLITSSGTMAIAKRRHLNLNLNLKSFKGAAHQRSIQESEGRAVSIGG